MFFENTIDYLGKNGFYIIEDVGLTDIILYKNYFSKLKNLYSIHFFNLKTPNKERDDYNRLIIISKNNS